MKSLLVLLLIWLSAGRILSKTLTGSFNSLKISEQNNTQYVRDIMRLAKAAEMRNYMNFQEDPCSNFYKFSCGNWVKINPANDVEHTTTGLFEMMSAAFDRKVEKLLKAGVEPTDLEVDKKVKDYYGSCANFNHKGADFKTKLFQIVEEFGAMPVLVGANWDENNFDWLTTVANIAHKYGKGIIIESKIMPDHAKNTVNRVYIGYSDFVLESRSMYADNITAIYREAYKALVANNLDIFLGVSEKLARQTANEIVKFEVAIALGMEDDSLGLSLDDLAVLTTVEEMQQKYAPKIDVRRLVNITLGEQVTAPVYEFSERFQKHLITVLERTPKKVVANYIFYNLLNDFWLATAKTKAKQEKTCVDNVKKYFAKVLDNMIYRKYNNKETENDVNLIWNELKATFKSLLLSNKLNWIRLSTRQYAVEKLNTMKLEINSYESDNFTEEFGELVIDKDDYIENIKNVLALSTKKSIAKLHLPPTKIDVGELLSYTPANSILENTIKVPVSFLQPFFLWAANYPNALKFGTLGVLIGHELIHGFDDVGRKYGKDGNRNDWWDENSTSAFEDRVECFKKHYSSYFYNGRHLPENAAQSENIADNGGVRLGYAAYLKWYEEAVNSQYDLQMETLPTLNYTSKQLFFISYAQVWCNDIHRSFRDALTLIDEHMPGEFRVLGPLSNFPEFAKVFNCDANNGIMTNKNVCEIY